MSTSVESDLTLDSARPLVSVIITTHNRADFLRQAISSVLSQSLTNFELIIIDNGSTDGTTDVISSFADPRIIYQPQSNQGRSAARNRGLQLAKGHYIAFLDDDDLYLPDKLLSQAKFLDQHPDIDLVAGGAIITDEFGRELGQWAKWQAMPKFDLTLFLKGCPFIPSIVLIRRSAFEELDGWFDTSLALAEDTDLFDRLALAGCRMAWNKQWVAYYRQHSANTQSDAAGNLRAKLKILNKVFSRNDLPSAVRDRREEIYAHLHLSAALQAYAVGKADLGRTEYATAIQLDPQLNQGRLPAALKLLTGFPNNFVVKDPHAFLHTIWQQLPSQVGYTIWQRREALSLFHMQRVFNTYSNRGARAISGHDWGAGVVYNPSWLLNRGVWSIGLRSIIAKLRGRD